MLNYKYYMGVNGHERTNIHEKIDRRFIAGNI